MDRETGTKPTPEPDGFGLRFRAKREAKGYSQAAAAEILGMTTRAIERWEAGHRTPPRRAQVRFLRSLEKSTVPPSPGRIAGARRNHHIDWEKGRGWFMRLTISLDAKRVGKRIKFRLKTRDIEEAIKRRDVVFSAFKALGFHVTQSGLIVPKTKPKQ